MPQGNPNPNLSTRFKPGQSGNPSGRSSAELKNLVEAAKIASALKLKAMQTLQAMVDAANTPEEIAGVLVATDALRLFKEVEDRAHGTPKQSVEATGSQGGPLVIQWRNAAD